ncbi:apolipoprotein A-I-2-like [Clarias gariepinus]
MKFVVLALGFLLAAGCQAELLQVVSQVAAPTQSEHRSKLVTYLIQLKESAKNFISHLDDALLKECLTETLNSAEIFIKSTAEYLKSVREGGGPQIVKFISDVRQRFTHDLQELHEELDPKIDELRRVIKKHLDEYQTLITLIGSVLKEFPENDHQMVKHIKAMLVSKPQYLQKNLTVNLEETKSKLTPIVEIIQKKVIEELVAIFGPHVQKYKELIGCHIDLLFPGTSLGHVG